MSWEKSLFAALLLFLPVAVLQAGSGSEEAKRWLERMVQAARSLNYEGTFVYVQGQTLEAMHILHSGSQNGGKQRMSSLNGSVREVLVAGKKVTCLWSKQPQLAFTAEKFSNRSPFPISLPRELSELEDNYQFEILGEDRVAGLDTQIVTIRPRDKWRFGYNLWLERHSALVLRSALLNENGDIVEQLMFTNVQVNTAIDEELLTTPTLSMLPLPAEDENREEIVTESNWLVSNLPAGFVQVMHDRFSRTAANKHPTEHIVFTDGLSTISVFVEALDGAKPFLLGASQIGAMNAFGAVIADHQVVVVGEVPLAAVQMVASSIQYQRDIPTK
jgi:sigma-E factor negative regulatory protein RseB